MRKHREISENSENVKRINSTEFTPLRSPEADAAYRAAVIAEIQSNPTQRNRGLRAIRAKHRAIDAVLRRQFHDVHSDVFLAGLGMWVTAELRARGELVAGLWVDALQEELWG